MDQRKFSWINQTFINSKKSFSLTVYQRNCFLNVGSKLPNVFSSTKNWISPLLLPKYFYMRKLLTKFIFFINLNYFATFFSREVKTKTFTITLRKQFLWIRETFLWYTVKERISFNWRMFCWFKQIFFNVNKSISLDPRHFFWINKTFFNLKKFFLWPYIKEIFFWFKETVF